MIKFKTNYTEKFINNTPERDFHYDLINQYGPWVANVSNKDDVNLIIAAPKMAEYMMDRAKRLDFLFYGTGLSREECERHYPSDWEELQTILSILKDAGVEVVE